MPAEGIDGSSAKGRSDKTSGAPSSPASLVESTAEAEESRATVATSDDPASARLSSASNTSRSPARGETKTKQNALKLTPLGRHRPGRLVVATKSACRKDLPGDLAAATRRRASNFRDSASEEATSNGLHDEAAAGQTTPTPTNATQHSSGASSDAKGQPLRRLARAAAADDAASHLWPDEAAAAAVVLAPAKAEATAKANANAEAEAPTKSNDSRNKSPRARGPSSCGESAPAADARADRGGAATKGARSRPVAREPEATSVTQAGSEGRRAQQARGRPDGSLTEGRPLPSVQAPHGPQLKPAAAASGVAIGRPAAAKAASRGASRSVRVKRAAALSSSSAESSLQQPLSFANSKLQSTRQTKPTLADSTNSTSNPKLPKQQQPSNRSIKAIKGSNILSRTGHRLFKRTSQLFPIKSPLSPASSSSSIRNRNMADQAVIDKLEAGFAKLQATTPEQCHSLLKKYLTREVLDKNKAKKTAMGATLLDVCQSGFENLDSGVGIYAPDAESYTLFSDLFDPIIEDYHGGFKPTDKHPASDFGDLETLVNVDPDNQFVISTRVRCGRSLKGYPFNPCLTEAQYKEMETKVSTTLKEVEGDLAGTHYPLTGMTKETQQQLIDDHFLFKEGDRFLQAANACRYWPTGRGIYHNKEKTFLVWVNEEDHLRIISMQKGGDLKTVFGRLVRGARAIEAKVPFSRDDRLGFLTFCPTNLGTTIRASVHIKLPKLAADRKKLEEVASRYNLQVRGTSGEHTESIGGVYDISNKRRLGLTEYQAVREMQDGILELIKIEKSL